MFILEFHFDVGQESRDFEEKFDIKRCTKKKGGQQHDHANCMHDHAKTTKCSRIKVEDNDMIMSK